MDAAGTRLWQGSARDFLSQVWNVKWDVLASAEELGGRIASADGIAGNICSARAFLANLRKRLYEPVS